MASGRVSSFAARALRGARTTAASRFFSSILRTLIARLRRPQVEPYEQFRRKLMAEAERDFGPADRALDRVYRDRPTAYTRRLSAIQGGKR